MIQTSQQGAVLFLITLTLTIATFAFGYCPEADRVTLRYLVNQEQSVELHMRRFKNYEGQPVILSHAVVLTNLAMKTIGCFLWQNGFDVWMPNMRGHGNGDERSVVIPYKKGSYGFDQIVTEDWPYVLQWVANLTQKKVHIIGYSMGGMTWEQTLSGVYKNRKGEVRQSEKIINKRSQMVASFTSLVVPPDLEKISSTIKSLISPLLPVFAKNHFFIPFTTNQTPGSHEWWKLNEVARRMMIRTVSPFFHLVIPSGVIERNNYSTKELNHLSIDQISSPHTDYIYDLVRWFDEPYKSRNGRVNYGNNKGVKVPSLSIVASDDQLAPADHSIEKSFLYPKEARIKIIYAKGFSHIDISFNKALFFFGRYVVEFLRSPKQFLSDQADIIEVGN